VHNNCASAVVHTQVYMFLSPSVNQESKEDFYYLLFLTIISVFCRSHAKTTSQPGLWSTFCMRFCIVGLIVQIPDDAVQLFVRSVFLWYSYDDAVSCRATIDKQLELERFDLAMLRWADG